MRKNMLKIIFYTFVWLNFLLCTVVSAHRSTNGNVARHHVEVKRSTLNVNGDSSSSVLDRLESQSGDSDDVGDNEQRNDDDENDDDDDGDVRLGERSSEPTVDYDNDDEDDDSSTFDSDSSVLRQQYNTHSYSTPARANRTLNCFAERFALPKIQKILSFGCANGEEVGALRARYENAFIVGMDSKFGTEIGAEMWASAKERFGDANTLFLEEKDAIARGPYDLVTAANVLYRHMELDEFNGFMRMLISKYVRPGGFIVLTSVLGNFKKLARVQQVDLLLKQKPEKAKFDGYTVLEWLRTHSVSARHLEREFDTSNTTVYVATRDSHKEHVATVTTHDHTEGRLNPDYYYRSSYHDIITLDVAEERDLKGGRLIQFVFAPEGNLRRSIITDRWREFFDRCVWNFHPSDLWLEPHPEGRRFDNVRRLYKWRVYNHRKPMEEEGDPLLY